MCAKSSRLPRTIPVPRASYDSTGARGEPITTSRAILMTPCRYWGKVDGRYSIRGLTRPVVGGTGCSIALTRRTGQLTMRLRTCNRARRASTHCYAGTWRQAAARPRDEAHRLPVDGVPTFNAWHGGGEIIALSLRTWLHMVAHGCTRPGLTRSLMLLMRRRSSAQHHRQLPRGRDRSQPVAADSHLWHGGGGGNAGRCPTRAPKRYLSLQALVSPELLPAHQRPLKVEPHDRIVGHLASVPPRSGPPQVRIALIALRLGLERRETERDR